MLVSGVFFLISGNVFNQTLDAHNLSEANSSNVTVEQITTEDVSSQDSGSSGGTHTIIGEDGYYYVVDDNGNILQSLGPSKKYHPNDPSSVYYPDAEPSNKYIDKS